MSLSPGNIPLNPSCQLSISQLTMSQPSMGQLATNFKTWAPQTTSSSPQLLYNNLIWSSQLTLNKLLKSFLSLDKTLDLRFKRKD